MGFVSEINGLLRLDQVDQAKPVIPYTRHVRRRRRGHLPEKYIFLLNPVDPKE